MLSFIAIGANPTARISGVLAFLTIPVNRLSVGPPLFGGHPRDAPRGLFSEAATCLRPPRSSSISASLSIGQTQSGRIAHFTMIGLAFSNSPQPKETGSGAGTVPPVELEIRCVSLGYSGSMMMCPGDFSQI
jgi:hypothetical protein